MNRNYRDELWAQKHTGRDYVTCVRKVMIDAAFDGDFRTAARLGSVLLALRLCDQTLDVRSDAG